MSDLDDPAPRSRLPLVSPGDPWLPHAVSAPLPRNPQCTRCALHRGAGYHVCMAADGPEGKPLVVLESPTEQDVAAGKFTTTRRSNEVLDMALAKAGLGRGQRRVCWSVSCPAGRAPTSDQVEACRPYLAAEFRGRPERALVFGSAAAEAVTGYPIWADRTRRAWAVVLGVPCFFVLDPQKAAHNSHHRAWLEEDVLWAATCPAPDAPDGIVEVMLSAEAARAYFLGVDRSQPLAFDTEYYPKSMWAPGEFQVLCASFAQDVGRPVVVPGAVLAQVVPELRALMESTAVGKVAQSAKNERHVLWRAYGIDLQGVEWDTLVVAGLSESEAPKGLGHIAMRVGMVGYKEAGQVGSSGEEDE